MEPAFGSEEIFAYLQAACVASQALGRLLLCCWTRTGVRIYIFSYLCMHGCALLQKELHALPEVLVSAVITCLMEARSLGLAQHSLIAQPPGLPDGLASGGFTPPTAQWCAIVHYLSNVFPNLEMVSCCLLDDGSLPTCPVWHCPGEHHSKKM